MNDERTLIARAMAGDHTAFDELDRRYRSKVLQFCLKIVQNRDDAEDVTAMTFLRAWIKRETYRVPQAVSFGSWLNAIARNFCLQLLSQRQRRQTHELPDYPTDIIENLPDPSAESSFIDRQSWSPLMRAAVRAMDKLPSKCRAAFLLMLEGYSHSEIARRMSVTPNNVGVIISRARTRLQKELASFMASATSHLPPETRLSPQARQRRREEVWREVETQLRGLVADFRLVTVPVNDSGATLQIWVPVLDVSRQKKFAQHLRRLQKRVAQKPNDAKAWLQLAAHHEAQGDLEKAIEAYQKCVGQSLRPCRPAVERKATAGTETPPYTERRTTLHALTQLGDCLWTLQRLRQAQDAFERALKLATDDAHIAALRGHLHALRNEHDQAIQHYTQALNHLTT